MKYYLFVGIFLLVLANSMPVAAQSMHAVEIALHTGYQQENFHWSIAGNSSGRQPNIYSELKWRKTGGPSVNATVRWTIHKAFLLEAAYNRAFITSGTVSDKDYQGDNRTQNTYNETFDGKDGYLQSIAAGAGYALIHKKGWLLVPVVGYTIAQQHLFLSDPGGAYKNLHSSYRTRWNGPYLKLHTAVQLPGKTKIVAGLAYQQLNYTAKANWNLIESFNHPLSFKDDAKGYGLDSYIQWMLAVGKVVSFYAGAAGYYRQTGKGVDELYLATGELRKTQFNEAVRSGFNLFVGCAVQIR